jgi:cytochrome c-type biogenesis protein
VSDTPNLGLLVAFAAGLLSFLSPCVLPLVPSYVGFLTGMSVPELSTRKRTALLHALCFVVGFSLIFVLLGASATALGRALKYNQVWLTRIGGVLITVFGLYCLGVFRFGALQMERRVHLEDKPVGFLGSVLVGMAFGAGWTPCIGPILGAILSLATVEADVGRGMLLAAVAVEKFFDWFQGFRRYLPWVMRVSGMLLVLVGVLMMTGEFTRLAGWLQALTPSFLKNRI